MLVLGYVLAKHFGGSLAGAVAGSLVSGTGWVPLERFVFREGIPLWPTLLICVVIIPIGLMFDRWRPVVLYPLWAAWNTLLYYRDRRNAPQHPILLRWNAAFLDEHQRLPLPGL